MAANEQDEELDWILEQVYGRTLHLKKPKAKAALLAWRDQHTKEAVARAEAKASIDGAKQFWIWFQPIMVDIWNGDITDPADIDKKVAKYRAELSAPQRSTGGGDE